MYDTCVISVLALLSIIDAVLSQAPYTPNVFTMDRSSLLTPRNRYQHYWNQSNVLII